MTTRAISLAACTVAAFLLAIPPAHAVDPAPCINGESESRSKSAVDEGEIRWTDATKYDASRTWALSTWQYSGAKIKLAPDSATTVNDLEFQDYTGPSGDRDPVASYVRDSGVGRTDFIRFNRSKMDGRNRAYQDSAAAHEVGHALGLCHKDGKILSLMWTSINVGMPVTEPQPVDKANYKKLWG
ncbi:matrixin family metalloprotease [Streptomyces sp. NPDC056883]|uniref:matrixin family metalloprotease n=1 Tax=Streptomyces sp. NPDC056883 TaxID=3345959 RepID=UPI00369A1898